jgi:integrase
LGIKKGIKKTSVHQAKRAIKGQAAIFNTRGAGMLSDQLIKGAIQRAVKEKRVVAIRDGAGGVAGLECRVSYKGTASFAYLYRRDGSTVRQRLYLGEYGSDYSLAKARRDAKIAQGQRAQGLDPIADRELKQAKQRQAEREVIAEEEAAARAVTLEELAKLFIASRDGPWAKKYRAILEKRALPVIGKKRAAASIVRADIQRLVDRVKEDGFPVQARRVFEVTRAMLRWAAGRDYISGEPWRGVDLPAKNDARTRVLNAGELRWLWKLTDRWSQTNPNLCRIVRLELLLGQRSGEVCGMRRRELPDSLLTWTIPAERCKNGTAHTVPLPPLARQILREAMSHRKSDDDEAGENDHLFLGTRGKPARADDIAHEIADAIHSFNDDRPQKQRIEPFTPHDFRRTVATSLEKMGVPTTVISKVLNHISEKSASVTSKHYTHADLEMEVRAALTRWQGTLERIIAGDDPFEARAEDIEALERRMLAKSSGGRARLHVVQK